MNPYFFLATIYDYDIVSIGVGEFIAAILPVTQLILAVCLLLAIWERAAFLLTAVLLSCFAAMQFIAFNRGLQIS